MKFEEYQLVRLIKDIPEKNLGAGAVGTVLLVYDKKPHLPQAYEVEFIDDKGRTLSNEYSVTVVEDDLDFIKD